MASKPLRPCRRAGCTALTRDGYCDKHKPAWTDKQHKDSAAWRHLYVSNTIVIDPDQKDEMEAALGATLLPAHPLGLKVGDLFNGVAWPRNVGGEQVVLPLGSDGQDAEVLLAILEGGNIDGLDA